MSKIPRGQSDKIILWLINTKQLTPDQAQDWYETMPQQCYYEYLARSNQMDNKINPTQQ